MTKEKFAWMPTKIWFMKTRDYHYKIIWLCWYWWDSDEADSPSGFHRLSDDPSDDTRLWSRNKIRTNTNKW